VTAEWTAPAVERADPDHVAAERRALEQWIGYHRVTLLAKCAGLTAGQLKRRSVPPSNLSLLGLVRHLADAERGWFRQCAAGEDVPDLYWTEADSVADFNDIEAADAEADLDTYRREIIAARKAVAGKGRSARLWPPTAPSSPRPARTCTPSVAGSCANSAAPNKHRPERRHAWTILDDLPRTTDQMITRSSH
jgi:hypothetical protein